MIRGEPIPVNHVLSAIYAQSHFRARWTSAFTVAQLMTELRRCRQDGLRPEDYHLDALEQMGLESIGEIPSPSYLAQRDLLLTDALVRLAFHLYYGKVDPQTLHPRWRMPPYIGNLEAAALINRKIEAGGIRLFIDSLRPDHPFYRRLRAALTTYRRMADAGGFPEIPDGPLIEKETRDSRVPLIRQRLQRSGDLPAASPDAGDLFDAAMEEATARFQDRHRIALFAPGVEDRYGAVGEETRERMNIPIEHLIDRIRVNLERARWVMRQLPGYFVIADIADFNVSLVESGKVVWHARAQVGDVYRKTPVFQSAIKYMEINPTWTVPPGILDYSILPHLKKDPADPLLRRFQVFDRNGKRVDQPESIPWSRYTGSSLPYRVVQPPGPSNPVGRIKFIFPNPDFVFMHDTPQKDFFDLERRDLSAGCVRIERPFELAAHLMRLDGRPGDDRAATMLSSGKTGRIHFRRPVPVILFYGTVTVNEQGAVTFLEDVYKRDPNLLAALEAPAGLWGMGIGQ